MKWLSAILLLLTISPAATAQNAPAGAGEVGVERQLLLKRKLAMGEETLLSTLRHNVQKWETLSPEQRQVFRDRAYAFRDAPPEKQQAILDAYEDFVQLSAQQKQEYRRRADWLKIVLANLPEEKKDLLRQLSPADCAKELLRLKAELQAEGKLPLDEPTTEPTPAP
jgi:hypothetical protein